MDDTEAKRKFAEALLRWPDNPFKAGMLVFNDPGRALQVANLWFNNPEIEALQEAMIAEKGEGAFLPDKEGFIRKLASEADSEFASEDYKAKILRLQAEVQGFIEKPGTKVDVSVTPKVMVVRESASDDEWEEKLRKQQERLEHDAAE